MIKTEEWHIAERLTEHYVCSDCWGVLTAYDAHNGTRAWEVHCHTSDCPCRSVVSMVYVTRRCAESGSELSEAIRALQDAIPWLKEEVQTQARKLTADEILHSLGF